MLESSTATDFIHYHKLESNDTISSSKSAVQMASIRPLQPLSQTKVAKGSPKLAHSSFVDLNAKKRKRDASPSSNFDKRARHSAGSLADLKRSAASQNDRPSPGPRSVPVTSKASSYPVNRYTSIARPCVASSQVDTTSYVSSYDIVKENLNNFKVREYTLPLCLLAWLPFSLVCGLTSSFSQTF